MFKMGDIKSYLKLFLLVPMVLSQVMLAQVQQEFEGPLKVGRFEGQAEYTYVLKDTDTVLDGNFTMHRSNLNALLKNTDDFFSFKGSFANGYPEGKWDFQFGEFQSGSGTEVVGYQYRIKVTGTQHEAHGSISQGKPNGVWTYVVKEIEDSEVKRTLFASTLEFEKGIPQKSFRIENEHNSMVGRFLRNGLAHDVWTLYSDEDPNTSESWYFDEGFLHKMEYSSADGSMISRNFDAPSGQTKIIGLDERFVKLIKIKQQEPDTSGVKGGIEQLLADNLEHYRELDDFLSALGESEFTPAFKVKVAHFPVDSTENSQLQAIRERYTDAQKTSQSLLENTQLNILRRSDEEAEFLYKVVSEISKSFLNPVGKIIDYQSQDILEFVSRDQLFHNLWSEGIPSKTILIKSEENDEEYVGPKADDFDFSGNTIATLHQLTEYAALSIEDISGKLNEKLLQESKQQEFVALEERMIAHSNHIGQIMDSVNQGLSKAERAALKSIQDLVDAQLEEYATMKDESAKIDFGNKVIACLKQLDGLTKAISQQPERWSTLVEKYKDDIWNPFMATIMNEEVKKRITNAYSNVLMPYLLDEVKSNLSCENAEQLKLLFDGSYERMLQMREEDTSKLERKLKRAQDPKIVLQLFNLNASENK
ncbi:hypothetical protein [Flagellimonas sp. 2504JD4-2]